MKFFKGFITGIIFVFSILIMIISIVAENKKTEISAILKDIDFRINGMYIDFFKPIVYEGKTYLPVRDICEYLDKDVKWDENYQRILINDEEIKGEVSLTGSFGTSDYYIKLYKDKDILLYDEFYGLKKVQLSDKQYKELLDIMNGFLNEEIDRKQLVVIHPPQAYDIMVTLDGNSKKGGELLKSSKYEFDAEQSKMSQELISKIEEIFDISIKFGPYPDA